MNLKGKLTHAVAGFFVGSLIFAALILGFSGTPKYLPFDAPIESVQKREVKEGISSRLYESPRPADSDLPIRLFQILIWLFLISPPIIVILLLVIISKMNRKNSME